MNTKSNKIIPDFTCFNLRYEIVLEQNNKANGFLKSFE